MVNFTREADDKTFADATKVVDAHDYHEEICVMDDMCTWTHRDVQSLAVDKKMHNVHIGPSAYLAMHNAEQSGDQPIFQYKMYRRHCSSANETKQG